MPRVRETGYRGVSFPFHFTEYGTLTTSTTGPSEVTHIKESIQQILMTGFNERVMLPDFGANLDWFIFEPDSELIPLMKHLLLQQLLHWEPRVKILVLSVIPDYNGSIVVNLEYQVISTSIYDRISVRIGSDV